MKPDPRILLVDDNGQDRGLASVVLSRDLPSARIVEVADASAFALALARPVDLVITEYELAWSDGQSVLKTIKESHPEVPVLMFTQGRDEELVLQLCLGAGVAVPVVVGPGDGERALGGVDRRIGGRRIELRRWGVLLDCERRHGGLGFQLCARHACARSPVKRLLP